MRFNRIHSSKSAQNSLWIISERIISVGITTIVTVLTARHLGTENYGILSYGLTLLTLFTGLMKLGIDAVIVNELINHKDQQGRLMGTSIVMRTVASILSIISIGLVLLVLNSGQPLLITVAMIQAVALIFQASHVLDYWFQSQLKSKYVSIAKVVATILTSIYSAYLLLTGKGVMWFAVSTVMTGLGIAAILFYFYKRQGGQRLEFSMDVARYILGKSYHFIIASIIIVIYVQIDKLMIGNMLNSSQLGIYSAALALCTAWSFLPDSIITSMRPSILIAKKKSEEKYLRRLKQLYFIIFWLCVGISAGIALLAPVLIWVLFGAAYSASAAIVQVAIWYVPLGMLGVARNIWLVAEEKSKYTKYFLIFGLITNVGLNLILLPRIGIMGAAVATVVTEIVTLFLAPLIYPPVRAHTTIILEALAYKLSPSK